MTKVTDDYRNRIATVDKKGKRVWIYPKAPVGKFFRWRTWVSYIQILVLFGLPFIKINGHPAVLLNVLERKFILFGFVFWPQDMYIFGLLLVTLMVFIVMTTATFGRVWCGWLCPQTVFLEMVFRKIERLLEGDSQKQKKLDKAPWTIHKAGIKIAKHIIFFALSFLIGNVFLAYIIGTDQLWKIITDPPSQHLIGLIAMILFSFIFYGNFIWFREQTCIIVCPYGRLQSVLQDSNTITVSYDFVRGEPRGKKTSDEENKIGDCVDCKQCIAVCPTGIDIRNGSQLECLACTSCIDSCDSIMEKLGRPTGLIRFASHNMIVEKKKFVFSIRTFAYFTILLILLTLDVLVLSMRPNTSTIISRVPGALYQQPDENHYSNAYSLKMLNKTFDQHVYSLRLLEPEGKIIVGGGDVMIAGQAIEQRTMLVVLDKKNIHAKNISLKIGVFEKDRLISTIKTNFVGPPLQQHKK